MKEEKVLKMSKKDIVKMYQERIALMQAKKSDRISEFFVKNDNSEYIVRNLNATLSFLELHNREFLESLKALNNNEKMTVKVFHKLLSEKLN